MKYKPAQRFTVLFVGSKLLQILLFADCLGNSTLLATFSSGTGSHLLFVRLLGLLLDDGKEKGLESFPVLPNKQKQNKGQLIEIGSVLESWQFS